MTLKLKPFETAKCSIIDGDYADFIAGAMETGDPAFIASALGAAARARGMSQVARDAGVTRVALYKSLNREGDPKLSTVLGVMKALGIRMSVTPGDS